jgi:hypothetical protein
LLWKKHLACRTEGGALYGRLNACRQRLQQLEVGASLALILTRVEAWVGNIIRRRGSNPVLIGETPQQRASISAWLTYFCV